jgi:hypothetical protein
MSDSQRSGAIGAATWETAMFAATMDQVLSREGTLDRLAALAWFMDSAIAIPGTRRTVGADAFLSFVPGIGSLAGTGISLYLLAEALRHGAPAGKLARMGANVAVDTALGAVPLIGPFFDMAFKANTRNLAILREHLEGSRP